MSCRLSMQTTGRCCKGMAPMFMCSGYHLWFTTGNRKNHVRTVHGYICVLASVGIIRTKGGYWLTAGQMGKYQAILLDHPNVIWKTMSFLKIQAFCCLLLWKRLPSITVWKFLKLSTVVGLIYLTSYWHRLIETYSRMAVVFLIMGSAG